MIADFELRDARDHLIELLNLGCPHPLQNLPVESERPMVPYNSKARIRIEFSQRGVLYELHDASGPVKCESSPVETQGNGGTLVLESCPLTETTTFTIRGVKLNSDGAAFLNQKVIIEVGLDNSLNAWITNPLNSSDHDSAARLVNYGESVEVVIEESQEGVTYELEVDGQTVSEEAVIGGPDYITLSTRPFMDDAIIRIRASKDSRIKTSKASKSKAAKATSESRDEVLLVVELRLHVRANPAVEVLAAQSIIPYSRSAVITLTKPQPGVYYQVFMHSIQDAEFAHGSAPDHTLLSVAVPGELDARIIAPLSNPLWNPPESYSPVGEMQQSSGDDLTFQLNSLQEDGLFIVQAQKQHETGKRADGISTLTPSAVQLTQAAVVLLEPDPKPGLSLGVTFRDGTTDGTLRVEGGQPGVFYTFISSHDGESIALPAYFHKRSSESVQFNKGLNELKLEVDFVIAGNYASDAFLRSDEVSPPVVVLDAPLLKPEMTLSLKAIKAQSRVSVMLTDALSIPLPPEIVLDTESGKILLKSSLLNETYQLLRSGEPIDAVLPGSGHPLEFEAENLPDKDYSLLIISTVQADIRLERVVKLPVNVSSQPE